jgi:hypothetical protein
MMPGLIGVAFPQSGIGRVLLAYLADADAVDPAVTDAEPPVSAWLKKCWLRVTPKIDKPAPTKGFRVSTVTLF